MLYDGMSRMVVQGLCDECRWLDGDFMSASYSRNSGGLLGTDYVVQYDVLSNPSLELAIYYDDCQFLTGSNGHEFSAVTVNTFVNARGKKTGSIVMAGNGEYIYTAIAYDIKGNITQTRTKGLNNYVENVTTNYTFTSNPMNVSLDVDAKYGEHFIASIANTYNPHNDKLGTSQSKVRHGGVEHSSLTTYSYDDLGRLKTVIRPFGSGTQGNIVYDYDLHGWVRSIATNSFKEWLYYANGIGTPCYNGNISSMMWQGNSYSQKRGYKYSYDSLDRLKSSVYGEHDDLSYNAGRYNETQEYDMNGNITRLQRYTGRLNQYKLMDDLDLSYNGNQLYQVTEHANSNPNEGAFEYNGSEYRESDSRRYYDTNGALTMDSSRGIANIDYDDNGNPKRIQFSNGNVTRYVYTAMGEKLRTVHYTAVPNISVGSGEQHELTPAEILYADSTDYLLGGNLILSNGRISMYRFDGGYWEASTASTTADDFAAFYYNTDHLGNNREVVRADGTLWQVTDYYPFGTPYDVSFNMQYPSTQPYRYNGKELDRMHGLNTYDYGARQYNSIVFTWDRMDPMAEKYYNVSPYAYCHNNPINIIDPDGMDDYYDEDGNYLGTNKKKTDYIYIAKKYKKSKDGGKVYIYTRIKINDSNVSAKAWSKVLTHTISMMRGVDVKKLQGGAISVLKFALGNGNGLDNMGDYNQPDMKVGIGQNASTIGNKITADIGIESYKMYETRSNIQNMLGVEEYQEHMVKGLHHSRENNNKIFYDMMHHATWSKTTPQYKESIIGYKNNPN